MTLFWSLLYVLPANCQNNLSLLKSIAGKYYSGDGRACNSLLTIHPDGTFSYDGYGHMPDAPKTHEEGQIELTKDGYLILKENRSFLFFKRTNGKTEALVPIKWDRRSYLVGKEEFPEFCDDINTGFEPRKDMHGDMFMRCGDETKAPKGVPLLPAQWQPLVLKVPLQGRVTKLLTANKCKVNLGQKDGVRVGLHLFAWDKDLSWARSNPNPNYPQEKGSLAMHVPIEWITSLIVQSVDSNSCIAGVEDKEAKFNHLKTGQSVTSR